MLYKILIISLFVFFNTQYSQINNQSQPEDILIETTTAIQNRDYLIYTKLLHPDAIWQFTKLINLFRSTELDDERVFSLFDVNSLDELISTSDTVYVVYRYSISVDNISITKIEVESFKQSEFGWRLLLKGDFEAVIEQLLDRYEKLID